MRPPVIVGTPVHYYTQIAEEQSNSAGMGPYYAVVTQVFESEQGYANLYVFPPFAGPYHTGSVPVREAAFAEMVGTDLPARWYEPMQFQRHVEVTLPPAFQDLMKRLDAAIAAAEAVHGSDED